MNRPNIILDGQIAVYQEHGQLLQRTLLKAGLRSFFELHISEVCCTAVVYVHAAPNVVRGQLDRLHLPNCLIDFHDDERKTAATYLVNHFGYELSVIAVQWHCQPLLLNHALPEAA